MGWKTKEWHFGLHGLRGLWIGVLLKSGREDYQGHKSWPYSSWRLAVQGFLMPSFFIRPNPVALLFQQLSEKLKVGDFIINDEDVLALESLCCHGYILCLSSGVMKCWVFGLFFPLFHFSNTPLLHYSNEFSMLDYTMSYSVSLSLTSRWSTQSPLSRLCSRLSISFRSPFSSL